VRTRYLGCITALSVFSMSTATAAGHCTLQTIGVLPVDMHGLRPLVWTKINGVKARFILDSGAFYSIIWRDAAAQYQLPITGGDTYYVRGAGGSEAALFATVKAFDFLGVRVPSAVQFVVIDQNMGSSSVGLLGQNVLRMSDVEYDLANGILRFFKPMGCEHQPLAYWAVSTPYSYVNLQYMNAAQPQLRTTAMINGHRVTVDFDTGAPRSYLSLEAAERIGISTSGPGAAFLGLSGGIGPVASKAWSVPVDTFQLGGEKVQHAHLLVANLDPQHQVGEVDDEMPDMLLGDDFFLSHRIYVAYGQKKLYFTYNGGPLFNLDLPQVAAGATRPPAMPGAAAQASAATAGQPASDAPTDADGFRRRGMAFASQREFGRALADLTRACKLAPGNADNYYERGVVHEQNGQAKSALEDFDTAIKLQPDDSDAHLARALLLLARSDADPAATKADIKSDLDTVGRLAAPAAGVRLALDDAYDRLGDYADALDQINQWLNTHRLKGEQATGLNNRCWLRASTNRDLNEALDDCDHALDLSGGDPDIFDSRALVYLRLGKPKDAITDYDEALDANPKIPTSLYGRGLAELRLGRKGPGQKDLAAAEKLDSGIAKRFAAMGLTP
jgi:tetratricopeptide (TPR) repeat protein/predicted aspartyl protease